ncbi:Bax inhibitor-1/YccA family protein [Humidisolicoccus flavus]|uniref:Bax inhibitor-1/YccA family protein n=1 Tax=Humidisolicoccus flavus TaxID=3111414 RepID=UPI0032491ED7
MSNPAFSTNPAFSEKARRNEARQGAQQQYGQQQYGQQQYGRPQYGQQAPAGAPQYNAPNPEQLGAMYDRPSAGSVDTNRLSYDGVIMKTLATLGVCALMFVVGLTFPVVAIPAAIVGFVLALILIFRKKPSAPLTLAYGAAQGLFAGGLSHMVEYGMGLPGIIFQALLATAAVFAVTLFLYSFRIVRVTPKFTRFFMIALGGYALFSLVNFVLMITGVNQDPWGLRSAEVFGIPLGLLLGGLAVLLGAYSLMIDFNGVEEGVKRGVPAAFGWTAAFGITMTVVWLYVEILRIIAIIRGSN